MREPFLLVDLPSLPGTPCPCGTARRAFANDGEAPCSVHRVQVSATAQPHYHTRLTEVYYVLEGEGQIELNGSLHPIRPGMAVMIRPGTRHRAVMGKSPMIILNIVVPPFAPADEWVDDAGSWTP